MTDPAALWDLSRRLYGPNWQTPLAKLLGVTPRTIQRWIRGEQAPRADALGLVVFAMQEKLNADLDAVREVASRR